MSALASELRKTLESTVVDARDKAERGARDALTALAVAASEPYSSMSEDERKLRKRLRARGRQLGDQRDSQKGTQNIERLVREMAYEHWHRMLFARFLAENQLLIEPSSGVAITLDECEELAAEEGTDLWGMAAQFAQGMLPEIFRTDDPVLALRLPLEIRQQLQGLVAGLAIESFTASDSLGWTYQFWQTKRKKEVNDSGVKIGADELSPVTQLFTEDYMVDFLLDNTLGAWHAGKKLAANPELASSAQTEDELRQAVALPDCPWSYLRFIKSEHNGGWSPAAGTFEGWPRTAAELKCLDPCMGSGHFVVAMFERLVALRLAEGEQLEASAVAAVIETNLFGLEIDPRCTQIAAFNLALAAWRRVGHCKLPAMNLACSGLAPNTREAEWLAMAGDNERLRNGMERLYRLFQKASVLGSLINPRGAEGDLLVADFHELQPLLEQALAQERQDDTAYEMAVTARGVAKAAEILADKFTLVATNVPYLKAENQGPELKDFIEKGFSDSKANLATAFIRRWLSTRSQGACIGLVSPQNWLSQPRYLKFRDVLIKSNLINCIARLGPRAFQSITGEIVNVLLCICSPQKNMNGAWSLDTSREKTPVLKQSKLLHGCWSELCLRDSAGRSQDNRIAFSDFDGEDRLASLGLTFKGITSNDDPAFLRCFWELDHCSEDWEFHLSSVEGQDLYGGRSNVILFEKGSGKMRKLSASQSQDRKRDLQGNQAWGKSGLAISLMGNFSVTPYEGEKFDTNISVFIPNSKSWIPGLFTYFSDPSFAKDLRAVDGALKLTNSSIKAISFDFLNWQQIAVKEYPNGMPRPYSSNPTQWLFNGHPPASDQPLHVALARLIGYQWPRQTGSSFADCSALDLDGLEEFADCDGIICLSPIRGEAAAADRLRSLLGPAFGDEWSNAKERDLLLETAVANDAKKAAHDLSEWLSKNFFIEHSKLFQSRPFIWQIWDGNPHGFSVLVNYHRLVAPNGKGRKTLELLTYSYLGDWIDRQKLDQAEGINGADDRLAAALDLQGQLKKILKGEPPYDIFVRWKPLHQQSIGWDPDINDGVRLNIRPFLNARLRKGGKAGAGILRAKPGTIKWKKDRGKEPNGSKEDFPWFWGWDETNASLVVDYGAPISEAPPAGDSFDGNRWNDLHYTRAAKEAARDLHRGDG